LRTATTHNAGSPSMNAGEQYHARGPMNFNTRGIGLNESYLCKVIG